MRVSYSVCDCWPQLMLVALAAGTPTASSASAVINLSMTWPPTEERTRPMGTSLKAGMLCLRWKAR